MDKVARGNAFKEIANKVSEFIVDIQDCYNDYLTAYFRVSHDTYDKSFIVVTIGVRFDDGIGIETEGRFDTNESSDKNDEILTKLILEFQEQVQSEIEFEEL